MIKRVTAKFKGLEAELEALRQFGAKVLPHTFKAFTEIGGRLINAVRRVSVEKNVGMRSGEYLRKWDESYSYPHEGNPLHLHLENDLPYAVALEEGRPGIDMLPHFLQSKKTRISAKGKPYLIIPFRHGTPGSVTMQPMPKDVHSVVSGQKFKRSFTTGDFRVTPNVYGKPVARYLHRWGSKYSAGQNQALHIPEGKNWASGKYEGMVKMSDPKKKHVGYLTFRVASEASRERNPNAWMLPAMQGKKIAETALTQMEPYIEASLQEAVAKDLQAMSGVA